MKKIHLALLIPFSALTLSACVQPSQTAKGLRSTTAGPLSVAAEPDSTARPKGISCMTSDGTATLADINEGAEALFQILSLDPKDLNTVHDRAARLSELEKDYSEHYLDDCSASGVTSENLNLRLEKLAVLEKETDADLIQAIAHDLWDLFNPNAAVSENGEENSANPYPLNHEAAN